MSDVNWRPETEAEEAEMMKHLAPEEREELEASRREYSGAIGKHHRAFDPKRYVM